MGEETIEIFWGGSMYVMPAEKKCGNCKKVKDADQFHISDGRLHSECRHCHNERAKVNYRDRRIRDVQLHINKISKLTKPQRFNAVMALYDRGTFGRKETRTILQEVEF